MQDNGTLPYAQIGHKVFLRPDDIEKILNENSRPALNGERYLTDKELSERISVSRRTLHEWRTEEIIGYVRLGGKVLYRESDVLKLLEKNFHKPYF